jgi:Transposase DDE domain
MWTQANRGTYKQSGMALPSDLTDAQRGASGAADPGGEGRRAAAQDGHARGDERDLLSPADGLSLAVSAARPVSSALDGPQYLPAIPARQGLGAHLGRTPYGAPRSARPRGQPDRRDHRQPVAESGRKRGAASRGEKDAVGYDAGKTVKGRKLHALVDVEGLPLRVIVHSAGIQDRDGAVLVLDKIRKRFPWLELVGRCRLQRPPNQIRRRQIALSPARDRQTHGRQERLRRAASPMGRRANLLMVRSQPPSRKGLREPRRHPRRVRNPRRNPIRHQRLARI